MKKFKRIFFRFITLVFISMFTSFAWSQNSEILNNWMKTDLSVTQFRNGDQIPEAKSQKEWKKAAEDGTPAFCYNTEDPENGVLYNWAAVNDSRGLAPKGWKIPSKEDFEKINSSNIALKPVATMGNQEKNFNFQANGYRSIEENEFLGNKFLSYHWTSESSENTRSWAFFIGVGSKKGLLTEERRENGFSVRCIKEVVAVIPEEKGNNNISNEIATSTTGTKPIKKSDNETFNKGNDKTTATGKEVKQPVVVEEKKTKKPERSDEKEITKTSGCISGNCNTGNGIFKYENGIIYEGSFKDNLKSGSGTMIYTTGDKYTGMWANDLKNGYGTVYFANGSKYEGIFKNDEKHGLGTYQYENGDKYVGDWVKNQKTGKGKYTWKNGNIYDGEWVNGLYNGYGVMTYTDGTVQKGMWIDDVFQKAPEKKEAKSVEFTNLSSSPIDLAVGYYEENMWITVGWYKVEIGKTFVYQLGMYDHTSVRWYAQCLPDFKRWSGDITMCTKSVAFKLINVSAEFCEESEKFTTLPITGTVTKHQFVD